VNCHFTTQIEGDVVILTDLTTGTSITNSAEGVVAEVALWMSETLYRIVYRDTLGGYDGLAHRGDQFLGFVPLNTRDRNRAIDLAKRGIDCNGKPWPT
jgi:hypothetical protein